MAKPSQRTTFIITVVILGAVILALIAGLVYASVSVAQAAEIKPAYGSPYEWDATMFPTCRVASLPLGVSRTTMSDSPILDVLDNFLSPQEAEEIIALANDRFARSAVVDPSTGTQKPDATRTSSTVFLDKSENELVRRIEERAAKAAGLPATFLERLQVTRYLHGQFYRPHFDYLPETPDVLANGQRAVTIFAYLADLPEEETGGATAFPKLGLKIRPKKGKAVLWHNMDHTGKVDPRTLHGGEEVLLPHSVKYGLNIWFRTKPQAHLQT